MDLQGSRAGVMVARPTHKPTVRRRDTMGAIGTQSTAVRGRAGRVAVLLTLLVAAGLPCVVACPVLKRALGDGPTRTHSRWPA